MKLNPTSPGSFAGVVYTTLSTEHFIEGFKGLTIGAEGAISLRTRSQRLIARYSAAEPHSIRGVGDVIVSEDLMRKMAANPQQGWYMTKTRLDNIERITCYRQVRGYPLTIFTGASTADFLAAWRGEVLQQGGLAAVVILTVLGCSVLVFLQQRRDRRAATGLQQLALEQALMLDNDMVGMMRLRGRNVVWQNRALSSLFGYAPGELLGQPTRQLYLDEASFREVGEAAYPAIESGRRYRQQLRMRRKDGTPVWIDLSGASVSGNESLWMMIDVSALKESEATARHLAVHDALTGLPNRVRFTERLAGALTLLGERVGLVAVCWVDLDGFKELNDQFGHEAGDVVLRVVAQRLQAGVRNHDLVARMGGDEFALLLTALRAPNGRIFALAQGPLSIGGHRYDANGNVIQKNHPTAGAIPNGATVEVGMPQAAAPAQVTFVLNEPDYTTASRVATAINAQLGAHVAHARDASGAWKSATTTAAWRRSRWKSQAETAIWDTVGAMTLSSPPCMNNSPLPARTTTTTSWPATSSPSPRIPRPGPAW